MTLLSSEIAANRASQSGMGFENLPPLAISSIPFQFLKSLDLSSVGLGVDAVPPCFEWELVVWKPLNEQFREELEGKPVEVFGKYMKLSELGKNQNGFGNRGYAYS